MDNQKKYVKLYYAPSFYRRNRKTGGLKITEPIEVKAKPGQYLTWGAQRKNEALNKQGTYITRHDAFDDSIIKFIRTGGAVFESRQECEAHVLNVLKKDLIGLSSTASELAKLIYEKETASNEAEN